jgi:hypothetical protein
MGQVYQCRWRICREINVFSRFEYHMFHVLYPLYPIYWPSYTTFLYCHERRTKYFSVSSHIFRKHLHYILLNCPNIAWILLYLNNHSELDDPPGFRSPQFEKSWQGNMYEPTPLERAGYLVSLDFWGLTPILLFGRRHVRNIPGLLRTVLLD